MALKKLALVVLLLALIAAGCTSTTNEGGGTDPDPDESTSTTEAQAVVGDDREDEESTEATQAGAWIVDPGAFPEPEPDPTPLEVSDEIRVGVLENGLTYFVRSNDSPGGSVALRLAVRAGGFHEDPLGTGVAHFLEHMMFNGTEQFPGGSLDATLRSIGAEIGPDFNAFTSTNSTGYQLQVVDDGDNVEIAFDVLSEWASAALIEPDAVADEAPVVREELRLRDESPGGIVGVFFEEAYQSGTPYEGVNVSGTAESVGEITEDALRAFYDTWYRPDNMAVIAVGDRSVDDLEDLIIDRFEDKEARGELTPQPNGGDFDLETEVSVDVLIEPSFGDSFISVDIPIRTWDTSTVGGDQLQTTEVLLGIAIDNRLVEGVESGRLDLRRAGGGYFLENNDLAYMGFNLDADDLVAGTEVFMTELQASLQNPFTEAEIQRAADVLRSAEEQRLEQFETIQDSDFADQLLFTFLRGGDISDVEDSVDRNLDFLDALTAEQANQHWGWMLTSAAPIVIIVGPDAERVGTPQEHLAAVAAASRATTELLEDDTVEIDELIETPDEVREIEFNDLQNGEVELVFANGHRVLFAESAISEGQIILTSESPGGRSVMGVDEGALADTALGAVSSSGTQEWSRTQLRRYLSSIDVALVPNVSDFTEGFSGGASTEDADVLFQLLHLAITEPAIDDVSFAQQLEASRDAVEQVSLDSETAVRVATADARSGGGNLAAAPTAEQLDALTADEALDIYEDRFSALDDHTIVIVGDIDEDDVVDLARTWIGTLPASSERETPGAYPDSGVVTEQLAVGSGSAAGSYRLTLISEREATIENRLIADLTSRIIDDRIFTIIREQLGATYGGSSFERFIEPGGETELVVNINGDPSRIDEIAATVEEELAAIAAGEFGAGDFAEGVAIIEAELNFISNGFITDSLFDEANSTGGDLLNRASQREALSSIGATDVSAYVEELLDSGQRIDIRNVPDRS